MVKRIEDSKNGRKDGMGHGHHHGQGRDDENGRGRDKSRKELASGISMTIVFGALYFLTGRQFFWIFPMVFAGILPLVQGATRLIEQRGSERPAKKLPPTRDSGEKAILRLARDNRGRVTPALAAVETDLSLEEAGKLLDGLASRGYAAMNVTGSGTIEYLFTEFLPEGRSTGEG